MSHIVQRGGLLDNFIEGNTLGDVSTYEKFDAEIQSRRLFVIPSFTQETGICVSDSTANIIWWSDGVRDVFWKTEVYDFEGDYSTVFEDGDVTYNPAKEEQRNIPKRIVVKFWIKTGLARIARALKTSSIQYDQTSTGVHPRRIIVPQQIDQCRVPAGDLSASHLAAFSMPGDTVTYTPESRLQGVLPTTIRDVLNASFADKGIQSEVQAIFRGERSIAEDEELVGMAFTLTHFSDTSLTSHQVACVKIYGVWHYIDNEFGVSIPMTFDRDQSVSIPVTDEQVNGPDTVFRYAGTKDVHRVQLVRKRNPDWNDNTFLWASNTDVIWDYLSGQDAEAIKPDQLTSSEVLNIPANREAERQKKRVLVVSKRTPHLLARRLLKRIAALTGIAIPSLPVTSSSVPPSIPTPPVTSSSVSPSIPTPPVTFPSVSSPSVTSQQPRLVPRYLGDDMVEWIPDPTANPGQGQTPVQKVGTLVLDTTPPTRFEPVYVMKHTDKIYKIITASERGVFIDNVTFTPRATVTIQGESRNGRYVKNGMFVQLSVASQKQDAVAVIPDHNSLSSTPTEWDGKNSMGQYMPLLILKHPTDVYFYHNAARVPSGWTRGVNVQLTLEDGRQTVGYLYTRPQGGTKRARTSHRPLSSPRRKVLRSSSSSKRRYTHRRQASRS